MRTLIVLSLVLVSSIFSQSNKIEENITIIFVKGGDKIDTTSVLYINEYGLYLKTNENIVLNVIDSIITNSKTIAVEIPKLAKNINISQENNSYLIDLSKAIIPRRVSTTKPIFQDETIMLRISNARAENFILTLNLSPSFFNILYFQMGFSNGNYNNVESYRLFSVLFGVGGKFETALGDIYLGVNAENKQLGISYSNTTYYNEFELFGSFEFSLRNDFFINNFIWSVGGKVYNSNVEVDGKTTTLHFHLGLGYLISTI